VRKLAAKLLWRVRQIVVDEGFTPHPDKQHVMRSHARQSVTGIVVNEKPTVDRDTLRRFRATLYQVEKDGPAGKQWNGNDNVLAALEGYAHFIRMVDAAKGTPLLARVRAVRAKWSGDGSTSAADAGRAGGQFRVRAAQGKAPWPDFWQAGTPTAPVLEKTQEQITTERKLAKAEAKAPQPAPEQARASTPAATQADEASIARAEDTARRSPLLVGGGRMTWAVAAVQGLIALLLSRKIGNNVPILAMLALYWLAVRVRRPLWIPYIVVMALIWAAMARH
jgi:RNA-directed DNA polymerase